LKSNQTRKNRLILRGTVGVWNCESSDYIKGCDGACILAVGFLAGAGGWSVTNVAAFSIPKNANPDMDLRFAAKQSAHGALILLSLHLPFQQELWISFEGSPHWPILRGFSCFDWHMGSQSLY
jgi:hypothetical protein